MYRLSNNRTYAAYIAGLAFAIFPVLTSADHSWGGYHWARTTPQFTLQVGDNLTAAWKTSLAIASADWNSPLTFGYSSTPLLTAITVGQTSSKRCSMILGTTQVCNYTYGRNGWLGLASINITDGTHITQGTAKMNDTYFNMSTYNNPNEKQHVMCQEIAHTFGLDHQSVDGSSQNTCMDYFSNTGSNAGSTASTRPNYHDFKELSSPIYAHLDSTTTVAVTTSASPATAAVDITDDPNSWGQIMHQSANGKSSIYERHNTDGSMTLTHVYWTDETAANCRGCDHRYDNHRQK